MSPADLGRLASLARGRAAGEQPLDYRISPEDVLDIKIPDLHEGQAGAAGGTRDNAQPATTAPSADRGVRVSNRGDIEIPVLGEVHAEGRTVAEFESDIARQLVTRGILRKPEVIIEITEYRGRAVTVMGSVTKPGTYPLSKPGATVLDMILSAGGPTESAGRIVQFTPADSADTARPVGSRPPASGRSSVSRNSETGHPIRIDLEVLLHSGPTNPDLNPIAYPGDVIRLSGQGTVEVDGWVDKPGAFPASSTLTLTGVLAAAGPQYAADLGSVKVRRTLSPGQQQTYTIDVDDVTEGRTPDFPLTDGDVVTVPLHKGKFIPYSLYSVGKNVVNVGGNIPLF